MKFYKYHVIVNLNKEFPIRSHPRPNRLETLYKWLSYGYEEYILHDNFTAWRGTQQPPERKLIIRNKAKGKSQSKEFFSKEDINTIINTCYYS